MKNFLSELITNAVLVSAALAWFLAQTTKIIVSFIRWGYDIRRFVGSGGMPSSHAATVTGLTVATMLTYGVGGFQFPAALFLAIIVVYDSMGVRFETGKQAKILNAMMERDLKQGIKPVQNRKLEEMMGHTLLEVIVGIAVGIFAAVAVHLILS